MVADDIAFENEVRRIARELWPSAVGGGAVIDGGRERDGEFVTEECIHLIECTTSRTKQKAIDDAKKLDGLIKKRRTTSSTRAVKGWFVTKEEPTADQRTVTQQYRGDIMAVSLSTLRSKLVKADEYLQTRANYRFGSVVNPETQGMDDRAAYVPMDPTDDQGRLQPLADLAESLCTGGRYVILGDYGIGKSTAMRELFLTIANGFQRGPASRFPILLNLRDHHGQTNAAEAMERHARNVGFGSPSHLVRAWRAGLAVILLDGFDELAVAGWRGEVTKLRKLRRDSMQLVREFVSNSPDGTGVCIAGREHFFDSPTERRDALGTGPGFGELFLSDFSEHQVQAYLAKRKWTDAIPAWVPTRPLLLGYLAVRGHLKAAVEAGGNVTPAQGWARLLELIAVREARIEVGVDADTVRGVIERLATKARRSSGDGLGPLLPHEITDAFRDVTGYAPDDRAMVLLQRLPGLGGPSAEDGSRSFIDEDLADVARAGDVARYVQDPFGFVPEGASDWQRTLGVLGTEVAANRCAALGLQAGMTSTALERSAGTIGHSALAADVYQVILALSHPYDHTRLTIDGVLVRDLVLAGATSGHDRVQFRNSLFQTVEVPSDADGGNLPRFHECLISRIDGRMSWDDLPADVFGDSCTIEAYTKSSETVAAIMGLAHIPVGCRVFLTVLRKLYFQAGSGRRESALLRGLDPRARGLVPAVLEVLRREGLAVPAHASGELVWLPVRAQSGRVRSIMGSVNASNDPAIVAAKGLA